MALAVSPASGHCLSEEELRQMQDDAMTKLNELKLNDPDRFRTLIKQHLSYYTNELLDEDAEKAVAFVESSTNSCFADDAASSSSSSTASQKAAALIRGALPRAKKAVKVRTDFRKVVIEHRHDFPIYSTGPHDLFASALTEETIAAADELIKFLDSPKMLATEGLFRLCGSKQRQELLKRELNRGASVEWNRLTNVDLVNAHDVATVLKQLFMSLKQPLIPEEHYPVYLDMIDFYDEGNVEMNSAGADEQVERKRVVRRMNAVKILFLLTSREQLELAKLLLHFLKKVADEGANLMSEASLGTVFAPCLFHLTPTKRQEETGTYCRLGLVLAEMIRHSDRLFVAPNRLLNEVRRYCKQQNEEGAAGEHCGFADFPPTPFSCSNQSPNKFFGRNFRKHTKKGSSKRRSRSADDLEATGPPAQSAAAGDNITEMELAKLCAHIQAMPNNEKYVKKVNKLANKPLTPEPLKQTESMFPKFFRKNIKSAKASVNRECSPESLTETEHLTRRTVKQNVVKARLKDQFHSTESSRAGQIDENRRVDRPESYLPNASISLDTPVKERRPGWFPHQGGDNAPLRSLNKPALRAEQEEKLRLTRTSETLPPAKRLQGTPLPCLEEFQQRLTIPVGYDAGKEKSVPRSKASVVPEENYNGLETMI